MTNDEKIGELLKKLRILSYQVDESKAEIDQLKRELLELRQSISSGTPEMVYEQPITVPDPVPVQPAEKKLVTAPSVSVPQPAAAPKQSPGFENFVGLRLIHLIGIVVLVIGLAIAVKYAIDKNLISPATRIMMAYLAGAGLLFFSYRLKSKYKGFSAILLAGGFCSLYFTTYAAFDFYHLIPRLLAFFLMLTLTVLTAWQSLRYNRKEIAILGMVGAYAIPFLVGEDNGRPYILLSYLLIINTGILYLSFKKYWPLLNNLAQFFTWLIFGAWLVSMNSIGKYFTTSIVFSSLFFALFFLAALVYKVVRHQRFGLADVWRIILNSFIYFSYASIMIDIKYNQTYTGLFTFLLAGLHIGTAFYVRSKKETDSRICYLLIAMGIAFAAIAIPIQFDEARWSCMAFMVMGTGLFYIGRKTNSSFYEICGYPLLLFGMLALSADWSTVYNGNQYSADIAKWQPLLNIHCLTGIFTATCFGILVWMNKRFRYEETLQKKYIVFQWLQYILPAVCLLLFYFTFNNEIGNYFDMKFRLSGKEIILADGNTQEKFDYDWLSFRNNWLIYYFMGFVLLCFGLLLTPWKSPVLKTVLTMLGVLALLVFLFVGLTEANMLRNKYFEPVDDGVTHISSWYLYTRYMGYVLAVLLLLIVNYLLRGKQTSLLNRFAPVFLYVITPLSLLILCSSEMIHWVKLIIFNHKGNVDIATGSANRFGLTILWSVFGFGLIIYGVLRKKRMLRIFSMLLLAVAILKLVFWDSAGLGEGFKIVLYISLGIILLIVSFLYQKFKDIIFSADGDTSGQDM
jgi:uncharacterized membrane protein